jgi:rRNA maturation endonuclease Nob1
LWFPGSQVAGIAGGVAIDILGKLTDTKSLFTIGSLVFVAGVAVGIVGRFRLRCPRCKDINYKYIGAFCMACGVQLQ